MTSTTTQPPSEVAQQPEPSPRRNRGLIVAVVVLAVIAIGLGIALVAQTAGDDDSAAIPDDIQAVLDEYLVIWETHDYEALQALVTDDFRHVNYQGVFEEIPYRDVRTIEMQAWMGRTEPPPNLQIERVGEPIVRGDGPWYVSIAENWDGSVPGIRHAYISTYVVVDTDGELRIDDIYSAWQVVNLEDG